MRALVARGASEPTANIACRAYSCTARRRGSPTKATEWRQASRAFREPRSAAHDCRGPVPPQSRNMSRAKHGSAAARQRTPSDFRTAATVPCSGRRPVAPDGRVHTVLVRLAGASTAYLRGGCEDRAERGAVGAAATAAERGAQAVVAERGRVARGSRCARKRALAAHHERAQTASWEGHRRTAWPRGGHGSRFALRCANLWSGTTHQRNATTQKCVALLRCANFWSGGALTNPSAIARHRVGTRMHDAGARTP